MDKTQEEVEFLGYFLYPSMYSERKRDLYLDPVYRYSSNEILHYELRFDELLIEANLLNAALEQFYKALPETHRQR